MASPRQAPVLRTKGSMADRIQKRLGNSGAGANPDQTVLSGSPNNARRTYHNLHHGGSAQDSSTWLPGRDLDGRPKDGGSPKDWGMPK
jgi:hypothetical protein